jgi:hypothetical protein
MLDPLVAFYDIHGEKREVRSRTPHETTFTSHETTATFYQNYLAMRDTADVTGDHNIVILIKFLNNQL